MNDIPVVVPEDFFGKPRSDRAIYILLPKAMGKIGPVEKTRQNQQQGYPFRGIDEILSAAQPVFAEFGITVVPTVVDQKREERQTQKGGTLIYSILTVHHRFYGPDGSYVESVTIGEAMDTSDKASTKAMTSALKAAIITVLALGTRDEDPDAISPEPAPRAQRQEPHVQTRPAAPPPAATAPSAEGLRSSIAVSITGLRFLGDEEDAQKATDAISRAGDEVAKLADLEKWARSKLDAMRARAEHGPGAEG